MAELGWGGLIENEDPLSSSTAAPVRDLSTVEGFTPNRIDAAALALTEDNLLGTMINFGSDLHTSMSYNSDPDFDISKREDLFANLDSAYWDEMRTAKSDEHAQALALKYGQMSKTAQYLDELGVEGQLYRVASVIADVPFISAIQKVRGIGKATTFLDKLNESYAGRVLFSGTIEGSFEGVKQLTSARDRSEMDMLLAVAGGGLIGGIYNPRKFDVETVNMMKEMTQETIDSVGQGVPLSTGSKVAQTIQDKQFNVTSFFNDSPSQTMRDIGGRLFNDVLQGTEQQVKAIEIRDNVKMALDNAFSLNFDPLYLEYAQMMYGKKWAMSSRLSASKQEEFYNLMGDIYYARENPLTANLPEQFLTKVQSAFGKMSDDSYDIMVRNKHTKFVDGSIERAENYMPLRWMRDKITTLSQEGRFKKSDFVKAVTNGMAKKFEELGLVATPERIEKAAKRFTETMYKVDIKIGENGYIMQENAMRRALDELTDWMELSPDEVAVIADKLREDKAGKALGTASATKNRTPLDLEGEYVTEDGFVIKLKDFVDTNVQSMWHRYGHSMSGDTAMRNLGIESRADLQRLRNKVVDELSGGTGVVTGKNQSYLDNFDATVGHLLGMSAKADPDGDAWKVVRLANNLTRAAKLGATWFAMSAEAARVSHRVGVMNMIRSIPALKDLTRAYRGKETSSVYKELQLFEALGGELNQMVSVAKYEDTLGSAVAQGEQRLLDKAERFGDAANEAVMLVGGVKSGTAVLEYMHAIGARVKMMRMAQKGMNQKAYDYFSLYGFDKETADSIADNIRRFGSDDTNAPLLNLDKWDGDLGHKWSIGVRRQSYEIVQRSNFGDNIGITAGGRLAGDTHLGSLAMSLKNYMLVAYNKQLSSGLVNIAKGGKARMDTLGNWGYQTAFTAVGYTAKQYSLYWNDPEMLEKNLTPERIAANTFSMTTFASFIPGVVDLAAKAVTDEPIFNTYGRDQGAMTIAPLDYANETVNAAVTVGNLISPWADAKEHELRKALGVLPLGNAIGVKSLTSELAEIFAED